MWNFNWELIQGKRLTKYVLERDFYVNCVPVESKFPNGCAIKSISVAFNVSEDDAYKFLGNAYHGKGTYVCAALERLKNKGAQITSWGNHGVSQAGRLYSHFHNKSAMTLQSFMKKYSKGTYILMINRHTVTIKDGVRYDTAVTMVKPSARVYVSIKV